MKRCILRGMVLQHPGRNKVEISVLHSENQTMTAGDPFVS